MRGEGRGGCVRAGERGSVVLTTCCEKAMIHPFRPGLLSHPPDVDLMLIDISVTEPDIILGGYWSGQSPTEPGSQPVAGKCSL